MLSHALAALLAVTVTLPLPAAAPGTAPSKAPAPITWKIDRTHSELTFRIRHLVSRVRGTFNDWDGTIVADPADWRGGSVEVAIRTASIDTGNERRDGHLRSPDFFDAEQNPTITFKSRSVEVTGETIKVHGDLTIRGTTRPITLEGTYLGATGTGEKQRIGFEASTKINRTDFGVTWNRAAEGGGTLLGDEVEIQIVVAATRG